MQRQILINVIVFVAYVLNLPLNTLRPHYRSQRAGKWSLILAHDRRPIYHAPTYIAVPLLGPHQPRYIESTLYCWSPKGWEGCTGFQSWSHCLTRGYGYGMIWTQSCRLAGGLGLSPRFPRVCCLLRAKLDK